MKHSSNIILALLPYVFFIVFVLGFPLYVLIRLLFVL